MHPICKSTIVVRLLCLPHTMFDWTTTGALVLGSVVVLYIGRRALSHRTSYPLPPGPPGLPWVGTVNGIDAGSPWVTYAEWAKTYGRCQDVPILCCSFNLTSIQATWSILASWEKISSSSTRKRSPRICLRTDPRITRTDPTLSRATSCIFASHRTLDLMSALQVWPRVQYCVFAIWRSMATAQAVFPPDLSRGCGT